MLETSQPWNLFGLDLRQAGSYLRAGWREFLWDQRSPVLAAVDEVVRVRQVGESDSYFRAGRKLSANESVPETAATAILLPEALVLGKTLEIPLAAEAELQSVIALEVSTSSPFTREDTSAGWVVTKRTDAHLQVFLVISSRSAVMAHVGQHFDTHEVDAQEIWAIADVAADLPSSTPPVVLSGFGESRRHERNKKRMGRLGATLGYCLLALIFVAGLAAFDKYLELQRAEAVYAEAQSESEESLRTREQLAQAKSVIAEAQRLSEVYRPPLPELMRLTKMLEHDTWLNSAKMEGKRIRIEGESANAAAVMQQLLDDPASISIAFYLTLHGRSVLVDCDELPRFPSLAPFCVDE